MIRNMLPGDLGAIKQVIDSNQLFPADLLDEMTAGYFAAAGSEEIWLTATVEGQPAAVAYCAPERMTVGTYNLYLIAVHRMHQSRGLGRTLVREIETRLTAKAGRILLVETSGSPEFERTRRFYDRLGYERAAMIKEFYQAGEDKIIFLKDLKSMQAQ